MMQLRIYAFIDSPWSVRLMGMVIGFGCAVGAWVASTVPIWWEIPPVFVLTWVGWCSAWFAVVVGLGRALLRIEKHRYPSYNPEKHKLRD